MKAPFAKIIIVLAVTSALGNTSCRQKERVLDVDTPAGRLKVDKDKQSGDIDIKVDDKK